jgi:pimeloyl-ACP methyl ester carboxylesterase
MKKSKNILAGMLLNAVIILQAGSSIAQPGPSEPVATETIRTFKVQIPQADIDQLRTRVLATRWPDKETVTDQSQGVRLAKLQELVHYWGTGYDWRKAEKKLNAFPQFMTTIDGLDIHFIHVRSKHANALPLIITHGWPGSVFELLKVIEPLTNPTAYGAKAGDAFDLVVPSIPGFGFSGKPTATGWNPERIGRVWDVLMKRLGYTRYVAQGGDWGAGIVSDMARQAPAGLLAIHSNLPATVPPEVGKALANGSDAGLELTKKESMTFNALHTFVTTRFGYALVMSTRPQTIAYSLMDSPAGLAAWIYDYNNGEQERLLSKDDVLDNITLYWLTKTAASAARIYQENGGRMLISAPSMKTSEISLPVAITVFPEEIYNAPESWARRAYRNLVYFHEVGKGGHFAAWEQPKIFAEEMRAAFKSFR